MVKLAQASGSALKPMQSGAFAHRMQVMLKNDTEFLIEFSQGPAAMTRQVQEATSGVLDATEVRARRSRQAG